MRNSIVVIEDDEAIRWLIKKVLDRRYEVHVFSHVGNAMKHMSKYGHPQMIITDIHLPVIDGKDFIKNLKKSILYGDIPVVVISSWKDEDTKRDCLSAGVVDFIEKPFNPEQLISTVNAVLSQRVESRSLTG
jgi:DNA-binding NtrC family response regulator